MNELTSAWTLPFGIWQDGALAGMLGVQGHDAVASFLGLGARGHADS
ncbi:hypothetical protein [Arthrobacter sp.]